MILFFGGGVLVIIISDLKIDLIMSEPPHINFPLYEPTVKPYGSLKHGSVNNSLDPIAHHQQ